MQFALESLDGVTSAKVGKKTGGTANTVVTAKKSTKVADMIAILKKRGFTATDITEKAEA